MKPTLQLKLSQQLNLTPQLQQSIRLLQLSTLELNQEIERIIQENPLLELNEGWNAKLFDSDETKNESQPDTALDGKEAAQTDQDYSLDWSEGSTYSNNTHNDEYEIPQIAAEPVSLREYLNQQISLSHASEREKKITTLLIDSLDDDGYLIQDLNELLEMLPVELGINIDDLNQSLTYLQHLDPPGVGARNLQECLLLQLQNLPEDTPHLNQAIEIVAQYLDVLASHDFALIKRLLKCDDQSLRVIQKLITNLNPKPGSDFSNTDTRYIIPDIIVSKVNGAWVANLNMDAVPRLNINHFYANILKQKHEESSQGLSTQLTEAKWLIKNLQQRSSTILKVSNAIVERQQQFFEHGEIAMRPLILREIAESLELHESTVSRVTTQKFMRTPRGILELKYFFGSHVATDTGGACSATAIRALIKQLIQKENTKKPLSDNKIANILEEQGIVVARRTIAKYRESMHIPPANLRKTF
ncbi:RNA polymerase factor sigma-54 [Nitrosomonas aestuarii]|uniref:RNA polymerase factor sigma-54 n=1 Tax=Nitrosomonas aestuarii TaxID=52441 RepID=UPI000D3242D1|nr:RNA polymerase factor sigma-54 [Nitrosomonas aestuarii]PTN12577.1 RNA polymerase RpoN-/SigL-like sigma 54 subunit [Nitrosomonas aestuarii]